MIGSQEIPMLRCPNEKCQYCFCFNCAVEVFIIFFYLLFLFLFFFCWWVFVRLSERESSSARARNQHAHVQSEKKRKVNTHTAQHSTCKKNIAVFFFQIFCPCVISKKKKKWHADSTCEQFQQWKKDNAAGQDKLRFFFVWILNNNRECTNHVIYLYCKKKKKICRVAT